METRHLNEVTLLKPCDCTVRCVYDEFMILFANLQQREVPFDVCQKNPDDMHSCLEHVIPDVSDQMGIIN